MYENLHYATAFGLKSVDILSFFLFPLSPLLCNVFMFYRPQIELF